jgi:2-oxoglutarate dehydrogenase E1 component
VVVEVDAIVEEAAKYKVEYIGFGMAHRGRLNALANVFKKPLQKIFAEFQ